MTSSLSASARRRMLSTITADTGGVLIGSTVPSLTDARMIT
jgi:hypothetical protein